MRKIAFAARLTMGALILSCEVGSAHAQGQGDEAFKRAMQERERTPDARNKNPTDWPRIEKDLRVALKADGVDSGRRVGGGVFNRGDEYLPHFFLGEARYQQGNCTDALNEWDESERAQRIQTTRYLKILQQGSSDCQKKGYLLARDWDTAHRQSELVIGQADLANGDLNKYLGAHLDLSNPDLRRRQIQAQADLLAARGKWQEGRSSRLGRDFEDAQQKAKAVREEFVAIRKGFEGLAAARAKEPVAPPVVPEIKRDPSTEIPADASSKAEAELSNAESRIKGIAQAPPKVAPEAAPAQLRAIDRAQKSVQAARTALQDSLNPPNLEKFKIAEELIGRLRGQLNRLVAPGPMAALAPPSEQFQTGANYFFKGQYEQAVATLTDDVAIETAEALKPDFYAIRAAANFALYERSGQADTLRRDNAVADVKRCKELKPDFRPREDTFSPRFIKFFDGTP